MTREKCDGYDHTFKVITVKLSALLGVYIKDVVHILDIHPIMLYRWKTRGLSSYAQKDIELLARIERIFGDVDGNPKYAKR